jgi:hypothetical protein
MFPGKFFQAEPIFAAMLEPSVINETPRAHKFSLVVHRMLTWFQMNPSLESIKLVSVALTDHQKVPFSVRIKHHFKMTTLGVPNLVKDVDSFAIDNLPYQELGNGAFELTKSSTVVQEFLRLVENSSDANALEVEYRALVAKIGMHMDSNFEPCSIVHDVGTLV